MIRGEDMVRPAFPAAVLSALVIILALASGCTGDGGDSQPPASTLTLPTTRATPPPVTTLPPVTTRQTVPVTTPIPAWTPGTVSQDGAAIQIQGDVEGYKSPTANYIDEIRFGVVKAPGAEPVTFEIPNTQIIFTKPGTPQFGVNYLILSGDLNGNRILEEGEAFLVSISFTSDASQNAIYAGQEFTMAIKNPPSPQITVTARAPPVLADTRMVLAAAPA